MLDDENSSFVPLLIFIEKQVGEFSGGQNLMAGAGAHPINASSYTDKKALFNLFN